MTNYSKWAEATPDEQVRVVATRSLGDRLEAVRDYLKKAAFEADKDVEYVHQMRVWSRRAHAALQLYRTLMPEWRVQRLAKQLGRIRRAANDARDDDVFAARLAEEKKNQAARLLLDRVREHRRQAQEPIVAIYGKLSKGEKLERRTAKLLNRVGTGSRSLLGSDRFGDWAACRLQAEIEPFFLAAAVDLSITDHLHQLRIAGKQLRYSMELLGAGLPETLRSNVYPMIRDLQDRLGTINDLATAQQRLQRWIQESPSKVERKFLESQWEIEQQRTATLCSEFLEWWNDHRETELRCGFEDVLNACQVV
jgi:CHAD domain-containing protein